jgi:hypothetical protein
VGGAHPYKKNKNKCFLREEHVGGAHPYKKNKNKCFLGVDIYPIITYKNIYN